MNDFITKFNNIPPVQRVIILIIIVLGLGIGSWFVLLEPIQQDIKKQEAAQSRLNEQVETQKQQIDKMAEVEATLARIQRQLRDAKDKLPENAEIPRLLRDIYNQAKTAGLEIVSFKRLPDSEKQYYTEIPVEMRFVGSYDELANFFYYVGRMDRIVNSSQIKLTRKEKGFGGSGNLEVEALATTFRYKNPKTAAVAPTKGAAPKKKAPKKN